MRVVSGIQPTGNLHLGNYLGAIKQWVAMQDAMGPGEDSLFFLADLHALTVAIDPKELNSNTIEMAATLLAAGIDPDRAILFNQARVREHSELAWILGGTARTGWLNRMTQWKDKAGKNREGASVGLYTYPVLQAADVLLYKATHVPVGDDQKQHLELARDIATKFNQDFGVELFPLPDPLISAAAPRIMSLRDGSAKMSKSDPSDGSRINLIDSDDTIVQKLKSEVRWRFAARQLWRVGRPARGEESGDDLCGAIGYFAGCGDDRVRWQGLRRVQAGARRSGRCKARPDS